MEALMVVDCQKGFINKENEEVVPLIKELVTHYQGLIIATKYINNDKILENWIDYHECKTSPEIDLIDFIEENSDYIFLKNIYSGITAEVKALLRNKNITKIYLVGFSTDCCILKTALDLLELHIEPIILPNYCGASKKSYHEAGLKLLSRLLGKKQFQDKIEESR